MKRKLFAYFVLSTSLALVATADAGDGKFEWTTESADAKKLIHELQSRIENFQFGSDTAELARNLVAADPDFAMGVYYLSAVVPGPEGSEALEKAVKLAETASEGERRFINAMVLARHNGGAGFAVAVPKLEALGSDYPNERLVQMILGQIHQAAGTPTKPVARSRGPSRLGRRAAAHARSSRMTTCCKASTRKPARASKPSRRCFQRAARPHPSATVSVYR